jgi:hypothetical protein
MERVSAADAPGVVATNSLHGASKKLELHMAARLQHAGSLGTTQTCRHIGRGVASVLRTSAAVHVDSGSADRAGREDSH